MQIPKLLWHCFLNLAKEWHHQKNEADMTSVFWPYSDSFPGFGTSWSFWGVLKASSLCTAQWFWLALAVAGAAAAVSTDEAVPATRWRCDLNHQPPRGMLWWLRSSHTVTWIHSNWGSCQSPLDEQVAVTWCSCCLTQVAGCSWKLLEGEKGLGCRIAG